MTKPVVLQSMTLIGIFLIASNTAYAALSIHNQAVKPPVVKAASNMPEDQIITGRAREQKLSKAIEQITGQIMDVKFVKPELVDMQVNWRASNEPLQIVLTKLARVNGLDIVINEPSETVYVDADTGQCDAYRQATLLKTKKLWTSLNITEMPTLPPRLPITLDASGYEYRLC